MNQPPPYTQFPRQTVSYAYPPPNPYQQQPGPGYHQYAGPPVPPAALTTAPAQQQQQQQTQQQHHQQQHQPQHQQHSHQPQQQQQHHQSYAHHPSSNAQQQSQPPSSATAAASTTQQRSSQSSLSRTPSLQSSLSQQRLVQQQTPPLQSPLTQHQQARSQQSTQHHHIQQQSDQHIRPFLPPAQYPARQQLRQSHAGPTSTPRVNARPGHVTGQNESSVAAGSTVGSRKSVLAETPGLHSRANGEVADSVQQSGARDSHVDKAREDDDHDDDADNHIDPDEPIYNLPPPPESNYSGEAELEKAIHAWSLQHGYELVRRASKKNAAGLLYKRYYHCSKHGKIANTGKLTEKTRVRTNRKSNRMGCPMSIAAVAIDPSNPAGEWQIRHRKTHHNHGPLEAVTMAGHRRRARVGGVEKAVDGLFAIGTSTTQVLQFLQRTNPGGLFTRTDVANMKLKYNKFGTCVKDEDSGRQISGVPSACLSCRAKKQRCDSARPVCGSCVAGNVLCEYDHEPPPPEEDVERNKTPVDPIPTGVVQSQSETQTSTPPVPPRSAQQILADLQSFQKEHVQPSRLTLQSSSVEILAQSSCGNGDSYRKLTRLMAASDWTAYHDSMMEAALKENTYDVLIGTKHEPKSNEESSVEDWNEYIKQLAIFNRRNSSLLGAIWGTVGPSFRPRIQGVSNAHAVWKILEETCLPRGSDQAFRLYLELTSVTLQSSANLRDYIARLEASHSQLLRLKVSATHDRNNGQAAGGNYAAKTSSSVFPEDQLCLFFMRNLGNEWRPWVDKVCASSNIAGFGTGPKIGFHDLTRQAIEFEALQSRHSNSFS